MKHTFKNLKLCSKIKSKKARLSASNAMIFSTKKKFLKSSLKRKKINLKILCQELLMIWKESLNTRNKNKQLKNLLKSKLLKRITHLKSFYWKMKFLNLKLPMLTETQNLNHNFKKIKILKSDMKTNWKTSRMKMIFWEREFLNLSKWIKLKSKIFNKNTVTFMSKVQQVWKSNIKDKSDFFWKKLTEKNGLLQKKMLKSNIWFLKKEISNHHLKTENYL